MMDSCLHLSHRMKVLLTRKQQQQQSSSSEEFLNASSPFSSIESEQNNITCISNDALIFDPSYLSSSAMGNLELSSTKHVPVDCSIPSSSSLEFDETIQSNGIDSMDDVSTYCFMESNERMKDDYDEWILHQSTLRKKLVVEEFPTTQTTNFQNTQEHLGVHALKKRPTDEQQQDDLGDVRKIKRNHSSSVLNSSNSNLSLPYEAQSNSSSCNMIHTYNKGDNEIDPCKHESSIYQELVTYHPEIVNDGVSEHLTPKEDNYTPVPDTSDNESKEMEYTCLAAPTNNRMEIASFASSSSSSYFISSSHYTQNHECNDISSINDNDKATEIETISHRRRLFNANNRKNNGNKNTKNMILLHTHDENSLQNFLLELRKRGLDMVLQEGDGNCLFRAISLQVYGDSDQHGEIRKKCIDYMVREFL